MSEYQIKNSVVEAQRFDVARVDEVAKWCNGNKVQSSSDGWWITLGKHTAVPGDYIVKMADGSFTPYSAEQFEDQYQPVGHTSGGDYVLARRLQDIGAVRHDALRDQDWVNAPVEVVEEQARLAYSDGGYEEGFHHGLSTPKGSAADDHTVELGGQVFTAAQWEVIQTYARGHAASAVTEATTINPMQAAVIEFQRAMDLPVLSTATPLPEERIGLRVQLIEEEFQELQDALVVGDIVETADACVDLLYVVFGLMVETGLDARVLFDEVHRSNMSKFGEDGKAIIAGENDPDGIFPGRVKKGPNYFRPNLAGIIENGMGNLEAWRV
ncbi:MazG-like nucleotide pyrophosphohydrolase [Microbacterium phage Kauala]|nr:MazG-like nucleotide pyrophosphohydrolase [Microbacterium phage Kauala]